MKQQNFKKPLSIVLSGFMVMSLGGVANLKINAESTQTPSINKFATADQLLNTENFNLNEVGENENIYGGKGTKAQKVYFGKNTIDHGRFLGISIGYRNNECYNTVIGVSEDVSGPQKWYIAGSEHDDNNGHDYLVLFSDPTQPLLSRVKFQENNSNNRYSESTLRTELLNLLNGTTMLTDAERNIMAETTYSTSNDSDGTDKLYAANWNCKDWNNWYEQIDLDKITVGLNDNINIHLSAIPGFIFWLRTPNLDINDVALMVYPTTLVSNLSVNDNGPSVVSASKIDLTSSSLIFASSASVASSSSSFSDENVMTFRYADKEGKIKSKAKLISDAIEVTKSDDVSDVYLYIQGKNDNQDWVYSTQVTDTTIVNKSEIGHGDVDLSQCKIWLETFAETDNMTYAKFVTEKSMD